VKKKLTILISGLLLIIGVALFTQSAQSANTPRKVTLPPHAKEVAPGVFDLGFTKDKKGRDVQGYAVLRFRQDGAQKSANARAGGKNSCFAFLSRGTKWKAVEDYLVDPANSEGLGSAFVSGTIGSAHGKWEDAGDGIVGSGTGVSIFGNEVSGIVDGADTVSPDDKNEVMFGDIDSPGAIAVTIVWGIFGGPTSGRELVEWDEVYDDVDFGWSSSGELTKMDFENIVTHEDGHAAGMGHPSDSCTEETMYRFATEGETKKRDLNSGDIKGISDLY